MLNLTLKPTGKNLKNKWIRVCSYHLLRKPRIQPNSRRNTRNITLDRKELKTQMKEYLLQDSTQSNLGGNKHLKIKTMKRWSFSLDLTVLNYNKDSLTVEAQIIRLSLLRERLITAAGKLRLTTVFLRMLEML